MQLKFLAPLMIGLAAPAVGATLSCTATEICDAGDCAEASGAAARLLFSDASGDGDAKGGGQAPRLNYRGEDIAMTAGPATALMQRWSGQTAAGEIQSFAFKPASGAFVAVTLRDGSTIAKASGSCEVQ